MKPAPLLLTAVIYDSYTGLYVSHDLTISAPIKQAAQFHRIPAIQMVDDMNRVTAQDRFKCLRIAQ